MMCYICCILINIQSILIDHIDVLNMNIVLGMMGSCSVLFLVCGFEPADQDQPGALTKFLDAVNWVDMEDRTSLVVLG